MLIQLWIDKPNQRKPFNDNNLLITHELRYCWPGLCFIILSMNQNQPSKSESISHRSGSYWHLLSRRYPPGTFASILIKIIFLCHYFLLVLCMRQLTILTNQAWRCKSIENTDQPTDSDARSSKRDLMILIRLNIECEKSPEMQGMNERTNQSIKKSHS